MKLSSIIAAGALLLCSTGCSKAQDIPKGLKDYYHSCFPVGVAVAPSSVSGSQRELIIQHFNSLTAENVMKPALIHPQERNYSFQNADIIAEFAWENGMKMRGHTLVWHKQSPSWFFRDANGNTASRELVLERLKEHITTVVSRYKGTVYAWDVVNEAVDDGNEIYRQTDWYRICGKEYIADAFRWAHEADPDAKLYYNDYNTENPAKREKIIKMIKELLDEGVPVHGIGLQGHWKINYPSETDLRKSLNEYSKLGIDIQVTELDVSVYPSTHTDPDDDAFTPEREKAQIDQYKTIFKILRDYRNVITGVTFWNVSDEKSWLDNFPVPGRKDYPLLFDRNNKPKKVYYEVVNL